MFTITVAHTKGGVGKSLLATQLAAHLASEGHRVLLVDSDRQASAAGFASLRPADRPPLQMMQIQVPTIHRDLPVLGAAHDYVVIDVGGFESKTLRSAVLAAHLVVVPLHPSVFDMWPTEQFLETLDEVAQIREPGTFRAALVLTKIVHGTRLAPETRATLAPALSDRPWAYVCETSIGQREIFKHCTAQGLAVTEIPNGGAAANELKLLIDDLQLPEPADDRLAIETTAAAS